MLAAWFWIRSHVVWVLGGVVALLSAWIAWGSYKRRVETLKDSLESERSLTHVRVLEAKRDAIIEQDKELAKVDEAIDMRIADAKRSAIEVVEAVEEKTDEEIADRFNELYR